MLVRLGAPPTLVLRVVRWIAALPRARVRLPVHRDPRVADRRRRWRSALADEHRGPRDPRRARAPDARRDPLRLARRARRRARSRRELREEIPGDPPESRFPKSPPVVPAPHALVARVKVERGVVFHSEEKRRVRLDIYRPAARVPDGERLPAVIQVHGGGWILGSRAEQGIPLLNHMAANGWIGFNVDYWLSPRATLPEHVIDVKRAIAWVREHADELGVDPERIAITGGSAGGHLTALAALTAGRPLASARLRGRRHIGHGGGSLLRHLRLPGARRSMRTCATGCSRRWS